VKGQWKRVTRRRSSRRYRIALLGLWLLLPMGCMAQGPEVSVGLYWLREFQQLRVVPQQEQVTVRTCTGCAPVAMSGAVEVRLVNDGLRAGRLRAGERGAEGATLEFAGRVRLEVPEHAPVTLVLATMLRAERGRIAVVVRLPLEEYVAGVLAGESSNFRSVESLKAMAVAARSYAAHYRGRHGDEGFDFCDTTHCQDLRLTATSDRLRAAAESTEGELLWFEGRPAATYYHRQCGGTTESAERVWPAAKAPYLRQQSDHYCVRQGRGEWRSELSRSELRRAVALAGFAPPQEIRAWEIVSRTPSGRVARVRLEGSTSLQLTAEALRLAVGRAVGWEKIRSDLYDVRSSGDRFLLHGYGAGHGVGLCQTGASHMGEAGKTYKEILDFYYPGTALGLTAQGLRWHALGGERLEILTTRPQQEGFLVEQAEGVLQEMEQTAGWRLQTRPQIRVYPSIDVYRNATGKPGWVAATTRGRVIRLQPAATLRGAGSLSETLRHELLHMIVESRAHRSLPHWFREGIVLAHTRPRREIPSANLPGLAAIEQALRESRTLAELRRAYDAAQAQVESLVRQYGRAAVWSWVERGLPASLPPSPAPGSGKR